MSTIFISHSEKDLGTVNDIVLGLEQAGYRTWYFERDALPGSSYLVQIDDAVDQCEAIVLVVSSNSIGSDQVGKEVVGAFERHKPFFPVLLDMDPPQLKERQPEWRHALGGTTMISVAAEGLPASVTRIIQGLKAQGIQPETGVVAQRHPAPPRASQPPKYLADKMLAARTSMEGERKQVTVLFADVKGFTSISEKLDPEELYDLLNECLGLISEEVYRYEGTITQFLGDGVMALFGAPIAHEYAPHRALHAALAIQRRLVDYAEQLRKRGIEFAMRIGLNTGLVVVGGIGDDLRMDYTAVGDTTNLASRMQTMAEPGTVQITDSTYRLTKGFFEFQPLGEIQVKGKEEPLKAYRVLGLGPASTRMGAAVMRGLTPFIGREREMELLMDAYERAKAGRGQAISLVGEAGVGKSRFLYEFRKTLATEDVTSIEGRCLLYGKGAAYHLVTDLLRSAFSIREDDRDDRIKGSVRRGLQGMRVEETQTSPYLLELLSVKDSGMDRISMSPEARKDRIREALKRIVLKSAEMRPLVVAVEDLHWIDGSSEEVLRYMLESIPGARVLLIFTYRPEYVHTWGGRSYHSQVTLNRLSNRESLAMAAHILGTDQIDKDLQDLILDKTEGIPFFIEEFLSSLRDLGMIEKRDEVYHLTKDSQQVAIPGTIQEVIMARVDALPQTAKTVLQIGSVIEREFSYQLVKRVTQLPEPELLSQLSVLRNAELLYERGIYPQSTYIFKHALTREVLYESMLTRRRKRLHVDIADAIEEIHRDALDEHCEVLAEHYIIGESYEKGAEYCRRAGRKAEKKASLNDAIKCVKRRVSCLERLSQTEDVLRKTVDARTTLGLYLTQITHLIEAKEAVEPVVHLALKLDYKRRISQVYGILGWHSWSMDEDYPRAQRYLTDGLRIAEELNDLPTLALVNLWLGSGSSMACEYEKASHHFGKAIDINTAANSLWGISVAKSWSAAWVYDFQGKINLGFKESYEALQIAEESGDIHSKAYGYGHHGFSCYCKGFLREAEEYFATGINFAERINDPGVTGMGYFWLAEAYLSRGMYVQAREVLERGISLFEQHRLFPSWLNLGRLAFALAKILCGDVDIQVEALYHCQAANKIKCLEGHVGRYMSDIMLNVEAMRLSEAEDLIKRAIEDDSRNGMRFHLGVDFAHYSEVCKRKGDSAMAEEKLSKAIRIFKECGADGWVTMAQEALARL